MLRLIYNYFATRSFHILIKSINLVLGISRLSDMRPIVIPMKSTVRHVADIFASRMVDGDVVVGTSLEVDVASVGIGHDSCARLAVLTNKALKGGSFGGLHNNGAGFPVFVTDANDSSLADCATTSVQFLVACLFLSRPPTSVSSTCI